MKASIKSVELMQKRLKSLDKSASADELEALAEITTEMFELETIDDIFEAGNSKLVETTNLASCKNSLINDLGATAESDILSINNDNLETIKSSKQDNLEIIAGLSKDKLCDLNAIIDDFKRINDVPKDSSVCNEVSQKLEKIKFLNAYDLPFVFGIISRYDDYYNGFTSELGNWYNASTDIMFGLLAGCHGYTTEYAGFYTEPKLCFFQGLHGNFSKKKSYIKNQYSTTIYKYPYAALGCLFVKNTTNQNITSMINFGGTSYTSTGGASMFVGVPNAVNQTITWTNVYSYSSSSSSVSSSASVTIPANATVCVLFYTSSYYISTPTNGTSSYGYHAQFLQWRLNNIRTGFLVDGLEIDFEKTLKAWQSQGFSNTFSIFS